jgi:hypothetical protein
MADPTPRTRRTCFVVMPVTTPKSYVDELGDPEHFTHVLEHLFKPALEQVGFTVIPPSVDGANLIHAEIIKNLEQADLVLCDLSSLNPNVFFELGIRTSLDRPVALIKDDLTAQIPFDLNAVNTLNYDSSLRPWALTTEIPRISNHIKAVVDMGMTGNALWKYFGLTKPALPSAAGGNPIEAKLDFLIGEFTKSETTHSSFAAAAVLRILLGSQLRQMRETKGITAQEAAAAIRGSESKVNRIELGRSSLREVDAIDLLTLYGVTDPVERDGFLTLSGQAWAPELT